MSLKHTKYSLFSRLPGRVGRVYRAKLDAVLQKQLLNQRLQAALEQCSNMVCLDIGANVGEITKQMAVFAGRVYAFEPDPLAFESLSDSTRHLPNVTLFNACVGISDESTILYRNSSFHLNPELHTQGSSMFIHQYVDRNTGIEVDQVDVISFIHGLRSDIGVIKIDAEGAEVPILQAMLGNKSVLKKIRYVFVETHERLFPEFGSQYLEIRRQVAGLTEPEINLDWY